MADVRSSSGTPLAGAFGGSDGTPIVVDTATGKSYVLVGSTVTKMGIAFPATVADGGTGITSYAVGDILYASGSTALSKLADVATGNALISGGVTTAPAWGKIGLTTHISGTLGVGNGGTGVTSSTGTVAVVLSTSPTLVTPILGVASATSINFGQTALAYYGEGSWTPTPTNLTVVGTPTYTGTYIKFGRVVFCVLRVTSTTSTASTANSTNFSGLPFSVERVCTCQAANTSVVSYGDGLVYTDNKVYTPTWTATADVVVTFTYIATT